MSNGSIELQLRISTLVEQLQAAFAYGQSGVTVSGQLFVVTKTLTGGSGKYVYNGPSGPDKCDFIPCDRTPGNPGTAHAAGIYENITIINGALVRYGQNICVYNGSVFATSTLELYVVPVAPPGPAFTLKYEIEVPLTVSIDGPIAVTLTYGTPAVTAITPGPVAAAVLAYVQMQASATTLSSSTLNLQGVGFLGPFLENPIVVAGLYYDTPSGILVLRVDFESNTRDADPAAVWDCVYDEWNNLYCGADFTDTLSALSAKTTLPTDWTLFVTEALILEAMSILLGQAMVGGFSPVTLGGFDPVTMTNIISAPLITITGDGPDGVNDSTSTASGTALNVPTPNETTATFTITITRSGPVGSAEFSWIEKASSTEVAKSSPAVTRPSVALGVGTGVTINFPAGNYVAGTQYTFTAFGPNGSVAFPTDSQLTDEMATLGYPYPPFPPTSGRFPSADGTPIINTELSIYINHYAIRVCLNYRNDNLRCDRAGSDSQPLSHLS